VAGRVFISYRRADTAQAASWLFNRLTEHFGQQQVIKDVDPAPYRGNLPQAIGAAVASCDVLILMIGPHWMAVTGEGLHDPNDYVRLATETALARGILVVPVTIDGARMPVPGELPPSLASMAGQPAFQVSMGNFDAESAQLLRILDQSITERQATQLAPSPGASTFPGPQAAATPVPAPLPYSTKPMPPRRRFGTRAIVLSAAGVVVIAAAAFFVFQTPGGHPAPSASGASSASAVSSQRGSTAPKATSSPSSASSGSANVILADDFSSQKTGWTDDAHQAAGAYTGSAYRLSVTGANGVSEIARPMNAAHGLAEVTPLNLSATVDVHKLSGAPQGYGLGIAFRSDGGGNVYAFLVEDHAVAIQKWTGGGAEVSDSPDPVPATLNPSTPDRLQAVCQTTDGGQAVHLELWLNGKKMVDYIDRNHPYTKGYMGLYVESISDASSTAGAEFDNFSASQP
jgi:TIR domain